MASKRKTSRMRSELSPSASEARSNSCSGRPTPIGRSLPRDLCAVRRSADEPLCSSPSSLRHATRVDRSLSRQSSGLVEASVPSCRSRPRAAAGVCWTAPRWSPAPLGRLAASPPLQQARFDRRRKTSCFRRGVKILPPPRQLSRILPAPRTPEARPLAMSSQGGRVQEATMRPTRRASCEARAEAHSRCAPSPPPSSLLASSVLLPSPGSG